MLERHIRWVNAGPPPVVANERAYRECGCSAYVGMRLDNHEPFIGFTPCSEEHEPQMRLFYDAYLESLGSPEARPAAEVADEIMAMVFDA